MLTVMVPAGPGVPSRVVVDLDAISVVELRRALAIYRTVLDKRNPRRDLDLPLALVLAECRQQGAQADTEGHPMSPRATAATVRHNHPVASADDLLTIAQVARRLGRSERTVKRRIADGSLLASRGRIRPGDLDAYIAASLAPRAAFA